MKCTTEYHSEYLENFTSYSPLITSYRLHSVWHSSCSILVSSYIESIMHFNSIYSFRNNKNTASYGINTEDVQFEAFVQFPNVITAYFEMQPDGVHEKEDEEKKRS